MLENYILAYVVFCVIYMFACLKIQEDKRKLDNERKTLYKEIEKSEKWLERRARDLELKEDRLNERIRKYNFLTK